ncbi:signal peptidase I [Pullulanibacillus camelliae]|uniref:Signal peptidase I n=1 Tax=Pullulanibacillus camelliae TaxID=1707096 RepID=A0A8J2YIB9_9BACL|nr:signal peptidase I [Pullulanibacillus camelliae]GGE44060.1 signal peptidase I [Pullulanibacillus camelliae]
MKKGEALSWIKTIALALIIALVVRHFLFGNYVVQGKSMQPTFQDGNRLIVNKIDYDISKPKRFDVIVFHATKTDDYIKRVIGLPGDKIAYKHDVLYVNGQPVKEPYLEPYKKDLTTGQLTEDFTLKGKTGQTRVPKDKLWVMGDNRRVSEDSRYFGFVDMKQVVGKVDLRYYPFDQTKLFAFHNGL